MGAHLIDGKVFQSDKYPSTPPGKVPLSVKDKTAQDLLWEYAQRRRVVDAEFSDDLEMALRIAGFNPAKLRLLRLAAEACGTDNDNPDTCGVCHKHFAECEAERASHDDPPFTDANTFPACPGARVRQALAA